ncbi:MAG: pilus assembly protein PilM [Candidatus Omnitrophica bacterium]|nr:pilus assembly protein PilM [Candidatus Omnitrophota bacterium]
MAFLGSSVGLYIGPKTVQIAHVTRVGGKVQLVNFVHVDIFENEQKSETVQRDEIVSNALKKALHKSKIDLKKVNTVLLPGTVLLRYFQMPHISPEEMEEAVRFEARKYIPFRLEEAVSGFYILKDDPQSKKVGILSLVTKEESIKSHLLVLSKVGISPVAVETASFALLRLLEFAHIVEKQKSNAVLYIYAQRVNIFILKNGIPLFVRDISLAKKEEWIDDETASLMMAGGSGLASRQEHTLENMLSEFRISQEYYKKELGKEEISKIILCGELDTFDEVESVAASAGEGAACPLAGYLQKKFNVPVATFDPLKFVLSPKIKPLPYTFPMLSVTIGAALRGLTKSSVEIDLFRARKRTSLRAKVFLRKLVVTEIFALTIAFFIVFGIFTLFVNKERNILEKEKMHRPKFVDLSAFTDEQLTTGQREVQERLSLYTTSLQRRIYLTHKLSLLAKNIPATMWIRDLDWSFSLMAQQKSVVSKYALSFNGYVFTVEKGAEIEIVNDFSEKLKNDPVFFEGFKVIKTGALTRADYLNIPILTFGMACSSDPLEK